MQEFGRHEGGSEKMEGGNFEVIRNSESNFQVEFQVEICRNDVLYKRFYNYMFDYLREDKQVLGKIFNLNSTWNLRIQYSIWKIFRNPTDFLF